MNAPNAQDERTVKGDAETALITLSIITPQLAALERLAYFVQGQDAPDDETWEIMRDALEKLWQFAEVSVGSKKP